MIAKQSIEERFWSKVDKTLGHGPQGECWVWVAGCDKRGYGKFRDGEKVFASRTGYRLQNGPIPDGMHVLHKCDYPPCVRGDHLFLGTGTDNVLDMVSKNRQSKGSHQHGSKLTEEKVVEIRRLYGEGGVSHRALAMRYGVSKPIITGILTGKLWKHVLSAFMLLLTVCVSSTFAGVIEPPSTLYEIAKPELPVEGDSGIYTVEAGTVHFYPEHDATKADLQDSILTYLTPYDNDAAEAKVLELINGAKTDIKVIAYGYTDPEINSALIAAWQRHVAVDVVMDKTEAGGPHQAPLVASLRAVGIPVDIGTSEEHGQLIHCKAMVIDDHITVSGSWNFSHPTSSYQDNEMDVIDSQKRAANFTMFFDKIRDFVVQQEARKAAK